MKVTVKNTDELEKCLAQADGSPLTVTLSSGDYYLERPIVLEEKDNVHLIGEHGARLIGGRRLTGARPVSDPALLDRFDEQIRSRIYEVDLRENGVADPAALVERDYITGLSVDGRAMHVSQYPKRGSYIKIRKYLTSVLPKIDDGWGKKYGVMEDGVIFKDPHVKAWHDPSSMWVHGFWIYDWSDSRERVTAFDPEKQLFKAGEKGHSSGGLEGNDRNLFRVGQRFYFYNILEEIDEPCAYFIDTEAGKIYFMPPDGSSADEVILSTMTKPVLSLKKCANVTLENLTVEVTRAEGILARDCEGLSILLCEVRNLRGDAINIRGGHRVTVRGCSVHDNGAAGICMDCGSRETLTAGESLIAENHIYRFGRWCLCYAGGISINGFGNTVRNNLIHDAPHSAMFFSGCDQLIERNEMYNVVQETGDAGAIYAGRDYVARGNVIRENFIHHLGGVGIGAMGIYNDDCLSGTTMERNLFLAVPRACMLGGGRALTVRGNVYVGCQPAIEIDSRGEPDLAIWRDIMRQLGEGVDNRLRKIPAYAEKYPETREIVDFFDAEECLPHIQPSALIENNVFCDSVNFRFEMGGISADLEMHNNCEVTYSDFAGADWCDYTLPAESLACRRGFENIDITKIGIADAACRSHAADVYSAFSVTTEYLYFKVYNRGSETTDVEYAFSSDLPEFHLGGYRFRATLAPGECRTASFPLPDGIYEQVPNGKYDLRRVNGMYRIRAYSPIPGVRPAEIYNKKEIIKIGV